MTFQKRQKEMNRQEKQRAKAERREQKGVAKRAAKEVRSAATTPLQGQAARASKEGP
jgi:hypothetical protein